MTEKAEKGTGTALAAPIAAGAGVLPWDPFALMDKLDADAFIAEMQGVASTELVYTIKGAGRDGKQDMVALSKGGIDECCTMLVSQGQCIREESVKYEMIGEGDQREAMFTAIAARYAVKADGTEVRLDQVIGVKREPLFEQRAAITLDRNVPGKKWKHLTYRQALLDDDARSYLDWIVTGSTFDEATKEFCRLILSGAEVQEFAGGMRKNEFWYEHGAMKACRNARARLIPAGVKAQVIAMANQSGRAREVSRDQARGRDEHPNAQPQQSGEEAQAQTQPAFQKVDGTLSGLTGAYKGAQWTGGGAVFPYPPYKGIPLNAKYHAGEKRAGKEPGAAPKDVGGEYVISNDRILQADKWAVDRLADEKKKQEPDDDKVSYFYDLTQEIAAEGKSRANEGTKANEPPAAAASERKADSGAKKK